jgi:hypothetical protein
MHLINVLKTLTNNPQALGVQRWAFSRFELILGI